MKQDSDIKQLDEVERAHAMMIVHNMKIDKLMNKYKEEMEKKAIAKERGITYKELLLEELREKGGSLATKDLAAVKKKGAKKTKKAAGGGNFEVEIVMKDETGAITNYQKNAEDDTQPQSAEDPTSEERKNENQADDVDE